MKCVVHSTYYKCSKPKSLRKLSERQDITSVFFGVHQCAIAQHHSKMTNYVFLNVPCELFK
uniref:Uncharacterized protein n=1 Tax=Triticum urartu TaxID=4572 RepID=A0A8R7TI57_TRIUA